MSKCPCDVAQLDQKTGRWHCIVCGKRSAEIDAEVQGMIEGTVRVLK